jgi:3-oxoacyl-[acyl-carrier protein] reductase
MFTGKVVIVTGAASGIGKSCFLSFMDKNANVVAVDLNGKRLEEMSKNIDNNRHIFVTADITKRSNIENIVSSALKKFGKIDILVNCAGICQEKSVEDLTETDWDRMMDINLKGTFFLCQAVLKEMKKNQSGKIVCMGSVAGEVGGILVGANYSSSKAGIICLTKSLAKYAAPYNINVNCVSPGFIDTEMTKDLAQDPKAVPLGRRGKPEDVSDVILFLSSDASRYITGANIDVNGGLFMG